VVPAGGRVASRAREPRPTPELRLLTDREREVMGLVAAGPTNVELAHLQLVSVGATADDAADAAVGPTRA
jgi:DNA-binding CsgD family transcriptional regulator